MVLSPHSLQQVRKGGSLGSLLELLRLILGVLVLILEQLGLHWCPKASGLTLGMCKKSFQWVREVLELSWLTSRVQFWPLQPRKLFTHKYMLSVSQKSKELSDPQAL